jgi:hypothetical protein
MSSAIPSIPEETAPSDLDRKAETFDDESSVSSVEESNHLQDDLSNTHSSGIVDSKVLFVSRIMAISFFLLAGAGVSAGMLILMSNENEQTVDKQVRKRITIKSLNSLIVS